MKIAFVVDPLEKLKAYKDSSVFMMREAARRGHGVFAFEAKHMALVGGDVVALAARLSVKVDNDHWYIAEKPVETKG